MTNESTLTTRTIGETESALNGILTMVLDGTGLDELGWIALRLVTLLPPPVAAIPAEAGSGPPAPAAAEQTAADAAPVERVKVANTGGIGVRLRAEPKQDGVRVTTLEDGKVVKTVGPDQQDANVTWKHVATVDDQFTGWVNSTYLTPTTKP